MSQPSPDASAVVHLSARQFVLGCVIAAAVVLTLGLTVVRPGPMFLAAEVLATILSLFLLGSFKYQIHKNALTYGMGIVVLATFFTVWWPSPQAVQTRQTLADRGAIAAFWPTLRWELLTFKGLDGLVHLDTMLFILGLTFFVCVIAQTRLLENITFKLLTFNKGWVLPTALATLASVAAASGVLDGVSMIGLTIRTLVIILALASASTATVRYCIMVCTIVTTVCGMWLAYGEPPNLIMKANLIDPATHQPYLTDGFFLRYCLPAAVCSFMVVAWSLRKRLRGLRVPVGELDLIDANAADVRFLQAMRHGQTMTALEFVEAKKDSFGHHFEPVLKQIQHGHSLGESLVRGQVPPGQRIELLGEFLSPEVARSLDQHYVHHVAGEKADAVNMQKQVERVLRQTHPLRLRAQRMGFVALATFLTVLVLHTLTHHAVPLFASSFAGFFVAILGIWSLPKMRNLALTEAKHEFAEYYFLFPLFLSITLLTRAHFFDQLQHLLQESVKTVAPGHIAWAQFAGATILSAMLDNNVVADFASRALHGLDLTLLHLFAMAQIAGYAAGGCWTHIGSAQSVVAFAFIRRNVDDKFTPVSWIKEMTPVLLSTLAVLSALIYFEGALVRYLG